MKVGDDISIGLTMDSRQFTVQVKNANVLLKELKKSLNDTAESTKKIDNHLTGVGGAFRHFMIMAATARFALLDFHDVFLRLPMSIIKTSGEIERMTKLMEGLSTASDKVADAQKGKNFVFNLAQNAPFDVKALTDSFVKLKSGGIDPMNGSMQALVDSVAKFGGSSEQLHRASIAIQQMGGKGVVSMEELRQQLGEAVPDAINMMAIGVGKSMSELVKSISKGEVESKSALERMFAVMAVHNHGAANAMMDTWNGMIEQLKTKWALFQYAVGGGEGGQGVFAEARAEVQSLLNAFDGGVARKFGADLSEGMYEFASAIRSVIGLVTEHYEEVKTFGQAMLAMFVVSKLSGFAAGVKAHLATISSAYTAAGLQYSEIEAKKVADSIKTTENEQVQARMRIVAMEGEIAAKQAQVVALQAQHAAANASYVAHNQVVRTGMVGNYIVENETRVASAKLAAQSLLTAEAIAVEGRALMSQNAVLAANIAETEALILAKKQLAASMLSVGSGATVAGRQVSALGGAFAAVGGWLTVLQIALVAAVWAWDKFGNAAEKNAERARRAANGMSMAEDAIKLRGSIKDLESELDENQKLAPEARLSVDGEPYKNKQKALAAMRKELADHERNLAKQSSDDAIRAQESDDKDALSKQTKALDERIDSSKRLLAKESDAILKNKKLSQAERTKQLKELQDKHAKETRDVGRDIAETEAKYYAEQIEKAKNAGSSEALIKALEQKHQDAIQKGVQNELIGTPNEKVGGKGAGEGAGGSSRLPVVGSMTKHLNDAEAELKAAQAQQKRVIGEISRADEIQIEVQAKYEKLLANGDLTKTYKDAKGKTKKESINLSKPEDEALFKKLVEVEVQARKTDVATGAVKSSAAALVSETELLNETLAESGIGAEFVNRKMSALSAEYEKQKRALGDVMTEAQKNIQSERMLVAAQIENAKYHQSAVDETSKLEIDLAENAQDKVRKQYELTTAKLEQEYQQRRNDFMIYAEINRMDETKEAEELLKLAVDFEQKKINALKRFERDAETPLERLGKQWEDVTGNMQQATANWANDFMDQMTQLITTGKADWRKFTISILTDIARISAQKAIGGAVSSIIGVAGSLLSSFLGGGASTSASTASSVAGYEGSGLGSGLRLADGGAFTNGVYADPTIFQFAKGGKFGVMGEAGPEAVMPLSRDSDGRLGVTVNGGTSEAPNVSIVIQVNNDGGDKETSNDSGAQVWKKMADRIKGVVKEEMVAQQRPGGLLYK